jgi:hypothetical protein
MLPWRVRRAKGIIYLTPHAPTYSPEPAEGVAPEAGAPDIEIEKRIAAAIFLALKNSDPLAFVEGDPESKRTVIDGTFNLEAVAKMILWDLGNLRA